MKLSFNMIFKVIPNVIDFVIFAFIALAIYLKSSTDIFTQQFLYYLFLCIPCIFMIGVTSYGFFNCFKQKTLYSLGILISSALLKSDYQTRVVKDFIIYSIHIALAVALMNPLYIFAIVMCLAYESIVYYAAFNPNMLNKVMDALEKHAQNLKNTSI